ncbi:MAG: universal stress protein [Bacillota bacterium]
MSVESLLIADNLAERSVKGRLRSRLMRDNAIEFAKKLNLDVELLFVMNLNSTLFKKKQLTVLSETVNAVKTSVENQFAKSQVPLKIKIKYGVPVEEILGEINFIDKLKILVLSTQGKKGLQKALLGSVTEDVLRNSQVPALVLGPIAQEKQAVLKLDKSLRIHFLTDLSDSSIEAERFVMNLCKQLNCPVVIIHSIGEQIKTLRENIYSTGYLTFNMEEMFNQMVDDAQRALQRKARNWNKQGIKATSLLFEKEEPLEKSLKLQRTSEAGLIVMGTHGRNKIVSSFIGSTARKVILTSPAPVIVVHSIKK